MSLDICVKQQQYKSLGFERDSEFYLKNVLFIAKNSSSLSNMFKLLHLKIAIRQQTPKSRLYYNIKIYSFSRLFYPKRLINEEHHKLSIKRATAVAVHNEFY